MNECLHCSNQTKNPKFCTKSCAATFNNKRFPKRQWQGPEKFDECQLCNKPLDRSGKKKQVKYCSKQCLADQKSSIVLENWLAGRISGLSTNGVVIPTVKDWLRKTRGDACEICGWAEVNIMTGKVPVVADHIDGNWRNNRPENLRLLCPNHDSLQTTYGALNIGKGRTQRKQQAVAV